MSHPMLPQATHDERAEQLFVRDLKMYIGGEIAPIKRSMAEALESEQLRGSNELDMDALRDDLLEHETFRTALSLERTSQEMLWDMIGESIGRQIGDLREKAAVSQPRGSLTLKPDFKIPAYIEAWDTHLMPGGFGADEGEGDVRQGALMDRGGAVYMLGSNGGMMNDGRGHTLVQHLFEHFPDFQPKRILELGCGVGNTAAAVASYFPDAEFHACDLGPGVLRYTHARSEHLGLAIHVSQQDAEHTDYADGSFDFVYTSIVFHEVSQAAITNIIREMHRLLRPGGVAINLDIAGRYEEMSTWQRLSGELDMNFNNEIGWKASVTADYAAIYKDAGFVDWRVGYQPAVARAERGGKGFREVGYAGDQRASRTWYVSSATKPA